MMLMFMVHVFLGLSFLFLCSNSLSFITIPKKLPFLSVAMAFCIATVRRYVNTFTNSKSHARKKHLFAGQHQKKLKQEYNLIVTKSTKKNTSLTRKQALWGALVAGQKRRESTPQSLLAGYTSQQKLTSVNTIHSTYHDL